MVRLRAVVSPASAERGFRSVLRRGLTKWSDEVRTFDPLLSRRLAGCSGTALFRSIKSGRRRGLFSGRRGWGGCSRFRSIRGGRIYRGARRPGGAEARNRRRRGGLIPGRCGAKYTIGRCARRGRPGERPEPDVVGSSLPLFTVARLGTVAYSNGGEPLPPTEPLRYRRGLFLPVRSGSNAPRKSRAIASHLVAVLHLVPEIHVHLLYFQ